MLLQNQDQDPQSMTKRPLKHCQLLGLVLIPVPHLLSKSLQNWSNHKEHRGTREGREVEGSHLDCQPNEEHCVSRESGSSKKIADIEWECLYEREADI